MEWKFNKISKILIIFVIIMGFIGINHFIINKEKEPRSIITKKVRLEQKDIAEEIILSGKVAVENDLLISNDPSKGEVRKIHVNEGDGVKTGDLLVSYKDPALMLEYEHIKTTIEIDYLHINRLNKQINNLEKEIKKHEGESEKKDAEQQISEQKDELEYELRLANITLRQNLDQKKYIEERIEKLEVYSSIDGVIYSINMDEEADADKPLIHIVNYENLIVRSYVSEYDVFKIDTGQAVNLKSDVFPDEIMQGVVNKIGSFPETSPTVENASNGISYYALEITISDSANQFKPGFNLIVEVKSDPRIIFVLPNEAVVEEEGTSYVFVEENGEIRRKTVSIGNKIGNDIEILEGIDEKEEVLISDNIYDGMEVGKR